MGSSSLILKQGKKTLLSPHSSSGARSNGQKIPALLKPSAITPAGSGAHNSDKENTPQGVKTHSSVTAARQHTLQSGSVLSVQSQAKLSLLSPAKLSVHSQAKLSMQNKAELSPWSSTAARQPLADLKNTSPLFSSHALQFAVAHVPFWGIAACSPEAAATLPTAATLEHISPAAHKTPLAVPDSTLPSVVCEAVLKTPVAELSGAGPVLRESQAEVSGSTFELGATPGRVADTLPAQHPATAHLPAISCEQVHPTLACRLAATTPAVVDQENVHRQQSVLAASSIQADAAEILCFAPSSSPKQQTAADSCDADAAAANQRSAGNASGAAGRKRGSVRVAAAIASSNGSQIKTRSQMAAQRHVVRMQTRSRSGKPARR